MHRFLPKDYTPDFTGNVGLFEVPVAELVAVAHELYGEKKLPLKTIVASDERDEKAGGFKIFYVFGVPELHSFLVPYIVLQDTEDFPSLSPTIHEAWNYERKIRTFFGLHPVGHTDKRSWNLHETWSESFHPLRKDTAWDDRAEGVKQAYQFEKVEGEGIYEIPVGPIHAGIIEPGHFRFSVAGEEIVLLEARLGWVHKGSEKLFEVLSLPDQLRLSEKISGDSSFNHSLAFCQAIESLAELSVPERAKYLRVIYAELERIANHIGDAGFIMLDTGFNFGGAHCARLREMVLQLHESLTGSRFLRGVNTVGGVAKDIKDDRVAVVSQRLDAIVKEFLEIIDIAENSGSLLNRLKTTGILTQQVATEHGAIGVPGKAVGFANDARLHYPYAAYAELGFDTIVTKEDGDVYARFRVRIEEVYAANQLTQKALEQLKGMSGPIATTHHDFKLQKNAFALGVVEGWRGDIVYAVITNSKGEIARVDVRDPSFLNWAALGHAGPGNIVPDFPLINKSFNLSYTGNDL